MDNSEGLYIGSARKKESPWKLKDYKYTLIMFDFFPNFWLDMHFFEEESYLYLVRDTPRRDIAGVFSGGSGCRVNRDQVRI